MSHLSPRVRKSASVIINTLLNLSIVLSLVSSLLLLPPAREVRADITSGLLGHWTFDNTAQDSAGSNHGTLVNGPTYASGQINQALQFDGSNDYVSLPGPSLNNTYTLSMWINPSSGGIGSYKTLITDSNGFDGIYLMSPSSSVCSSSQRINFYEAGGSGDNCGNTVLSNGTWYHVVAVNNNGSVTIYLNGAVDGSGSTSAGFSVARFGARTANQYAYAGLIDDVRIYNRALSPSDVTELYNFTGAPQDTTPPTRSNGSPSGTLPAGTTQTVLSLTTNEAATCRYSTTASTAYSSMPNTFTTTGGTSHSTTISGLSNGQSYTYYVRCQDGAGNANPDDFTVSFSVAQSQSTNTIFTTQIPAILLDSDTSPVELGVKFRSDVPGTITGIRFYKGGSANGGTHLGRLWSSTGTLLGQVTFSNESASGWQTATFATPISIQANTTYVASYFAPQGRYSATSNGLANAVDNPPLHALSSSSSGGNGVYLYSATGGFPTNTFQATNYWVDVVFTSGPADTTPPTVSLTAPSNGATVSNTITVSASASDAGGVAGVQFLLDGANLSTEDTTSPYSISWNTTTATNGSHTLSARARDAAGNTTSSAGVTVTVNNVVLNPDTTPPTTPTNLQASAQSSSQINVTWTASTDPTVSGAITSSVANYQLERCQGSSCSIFAQIATPTGTSYSDTGLTANTTYSYRVLARDGAGNPSSYSSIVSETTMQSGGGGGQTTGGVNWLDPLGYTKPQFYPIAVPDEGSVMNKYYVDMTGGSGTTCSQASPCKNISDVYGKPGTTGGPAYIYLKGSGRLVITGTLYGSLGNEIVIKPWPGDSNIVTLPNTGSGTVSGANTISGTGVHHLIVDGGPDLQFSFTGTGSSQNAYTLNISASNITIARTRIQGGSAQGPALGIATGATGIDNVRWINNEMFNTPNYYGVYTGGGASCTTGNTSHSNLHFINNIFRQICGRGIQIEPRTSGTDTYIEGNAFHDGFDGLSCGVTISRAIEPAGACGGNIDGVYVRNNIAFELGGGFLQLDGSNIVADNNTIYRYGKTSPISLGSHAFSPAGSSNSGTLRNNIVLTPVQSGVNAFNRTGYSNTNSLCESGCTVNSTPGATFTSTTQGATYLQLKTGSPAISAGANLTSVWSTLWGGAAFDYAGMTRTASGAWDIGAFAYESGGDTTPPSTPSLNTPTVISATQINLSWSQSTDTGGSGLSNYELYRCAGTSCTPTTLIASPTGTTYSDTGLTANTTYHYRVRATDAAGNPSGYSNIVSATTQSSGPLVGDLNSDGTVNALDWGIMNAAWFTSDPTSDINGDGLVNSLDFGLMNNNWGMSS